MATYKNSQAARRRRLSIFIADDEVDMVTTLSAILREEGHVVYTTTNAKVALEQIRHYKPDVCILDIVMPHRNGYELARDVRDLKLAPRPVLVACSGVYTKPSEQLLAKSVGFDYFLQKPAAPAELVRLLDSLATDGPAAG